MALKINRLTCDYRCDPVGIGSEKPLLQWVVQGDAQAAYRISAATRPALLDAPDLWDSGRVCGRESRAIYEGAEPASNQRVCWRVCVWDGEDNACESEIAFWQQGIRAEDWAAKWIGHDEGRDGYDPSVPYYCADDFMKGVNHPFLPKPALLRTEFKLREKIERATLYVSAMGLTEMYLNGAKATQGHMVPGNCDYRKRVYYRAFDVTERLVPGANALGAVLADGWYAGYIGLTPRQWWGAKPRLSAELIVEYADGSTQIVVTDENWRGCTGPWLYADIMHGTGYDATLEPIGWKEAGFDGVAWKPVELGAEHDHIPGAHPGVPIVEHWRRPARKLLQINENEAIYDAGSCFSGVICAKVQGHRGARIEFDHAEELNEARTELHYFGNRSAQSHDTYILSGEGVETFQPEFTYHGFRYVHVFGLRDVELLSMEGVAISSALPDATVLESENETVNRVLELIRNTEQSNLYDMPTDVCARDERLGWGAEGNFFMHTACALNNNALFLRKWLQDALDGQMEDGGMWAIAPAVIMKDIVPFMGDLQSDMALHIAWLLMRNYKDIQSVRAAYPALERYFDYSMRNSDRCLRFATARDWLDLGHDGRSDFDHGYGTCDPTLLGTAWFARSARMMEEISRGIGETERAAHYAEAYGKIRAAFRTFFLGRNRLLRGATQGGYLAAAAFGLLEGDELTAARDWVLRDMERNGGITWGTATTPVALEGMCRLGLHREAAAFIRRREFPSIGYMADCGATAVWERWDAIYQKRYHPHAMNAFDHIGLATVGEWILTGLAGLAPEADGYDVIRMQPVLDREIGGMRAVVQTIHGETEIEWRFEGQNVRLRAVVPQGASGRLVLPENVYAIRTVQGEEGTGEICNAGGMTAVSLEPGAYEFIISTLI